MSKFDPTVTITDTTGGTYEGLSSLAYTWVALTPGTYKGTYGHKLSPAPVNVIVNEKSSHARYLQHLCSECDATFDASYMRDNHIAQTHRKIYTADGVQATNGMPVWDYDMNLMVVDLTNAKFGGATKLAKDVWFDCKTPLGARGSLMNGERICTVHPFSRQSAAEAYAATSETNVPAPVKFVKSAAKKRTTKKASVPFDAKSVLDDIFGTAL